MPIINISKKAVGDLIVLLNCELRGKNMSLEQAESLNSVFRQLSENGVLCGDHETMEARRKEKPSRKSAKASP